MRIPFDLLWKWLLAVTVLSALMAVVLMVAPDSAIMREYNATWSRAFYGADVLPPAALAQHKMSMGVSGAGVLGWAVTLLFVVMGPYRRREPWAWWSIAVSVPAWAVSDLVLSVVHGVSGEVLFAGAALVGIMLPVLLAKPHFPPR
ncbi:MAG: hypothetical protein AB2A00_26270 [Myxococcota bacterium]